MILKKIYSIAVSFLLLTAGCCISSNCLAQSDAKPGFGITVVQTNPEFPGSTDSLQAFLKKHIAYPDSARLHGVQGKVYVSFTVNSKGKISEVKSLNSLNKDLESEAVRVVSLMPDWKPGTSGGKPVDVQYILPIEFILPDPR